MNRDEQTLKNSASYFANRDCPYFPCHERAKGRVNFNCLFCYCPMYKLDDCPGTPSYRTLPSGKQIKDCTNCIFPHEPENYDAVMKVLKEHYFS